MPKCDFNNCKTQNFIFCEAFRTRDLVALWNCRQIQIQLKCLISKVVHCLTQLGAPVDVL